MKKVMLVLSGVFITTVMLSQTTLKNFKRGVMLANPDSIKTNMVVDHIVKELHNQAFSLKTGAVYDVTDLDATKCYRELINRKTSTPFYFLVDCKETHSRRGIYFMKKKLLGE